jgi:hypothetical protein
VAKKPFKHDEMSPIKCSRPGCKRFIKKNLVARKENHQGLLCRRHYWENHPVLSARGRR